MILRARRFLTIAVFCSLLCAYRSFAEAAASCQLVIHVDNIRNEKGDIGSAIYNSPDGWPDHNEKAFRHGPNPFTGSTATINVDGLPAGDYAVVVIHDENKNHKLDKNLVGWPTEGFGFANNPKVGLSSPTFKDSLTHVTCPVTEITIHMQYK